MPAGRGGPDGGVWGAEGPVVRRRHGAGHGQERQAVKTCPWASGSRSSKDGQTRDGGPCGDMAVGCHQGATTYL